MAFKNIVQFTKSIRDFTDNLMPEKANQFFRLIALEILRRVVLKTPVDTGRARGNWQLTVNNQPDSEVESVGSQSATVEAGLSNSSNARIGDVIFITNNVPYVLYLEEGTDKMPPQKMLAEALQEVETSTRGV